ncbi:MAG: hypothetical protein AAB862_00745, partial [Patescibacteria group bacterium]
MPNAFLYFFRRAVSFYDGPIVFFGKLKMNFANAIGKRVVAFVFVAFLNTRGKGKVLWGSDYPVLLFKECMDQVDAMKLKEDAKSLLLYDVA